MTSPVASGPPNLPPAGPLVGLNETPPVQNGVATSSDPALNPASSVSKALEKLGAQTFYEKPLTSSDANGAGRVVIPKVSVWDMEC